VIRWAAQPRSTLRPFWRSQYGHKTFPASFNEASGTSGRHRASPARRLPAEALWLRKTLQAP